MVQSLWITTRWAVLPLLIGTAIVNLAWPGLSWNNELFHVFIEAGGSLLAFGLAFIVYAMMQKQQLAYNYTWLIYAFVVMGTLDLFHSQTHPGQAFVWLHSVATLFGGLLVTLIWLPESISAKAHRSVFFWSAFALSVAFSLFSMQWPEQTIPMLDEQKAFTVGANVLNILGGLGFFLSWLYFSKQYQQTKNEHSSYFSNHFLLFAIAGALFEFSILWDGNWWFWHLIRAFAYVYLLLHFSQAYRKNLLFSIDQSQQIFEQSLNEIYMFDIDKFLFVDVNKSARENLGYTMDELRKMTAFNIKPEVTEEQFHQMITPLLNGTEKKLIFTTTHQRKDGSCYPVEVHLQITDEKPHLFYAIILDISERLKYQRDLEEQIQFNDTILEVAGNVIVVLDLDGCFVRFNHAAELLTGYKRDDLIGKSIWDYVIPEEQKESVQSVFQLLKEGKTALADKYENEWLTRNGDRIFLQWHNTVLSDSQGNLTHVVALGYDITEQKSAEIERGRLQNELQQSQKMESLGHLTGGIAHDFNNLLGIVNGYASMATTMYSEKDEKLTKYLTRIQDAGRRAENLVKQMLSFSRSGDLEDELVDLPEVMLEDIKLLRSSLPTSIDIQTNIDEDVPPILMNKTYLNQILMNLAVNARDAMNGNGILHIEIKFLRNIDARSQVSHKMITGDWVALVVKDTGMGVPVELIQKIFNPFFTTKDVGKGTGMGLSVIYRIVEDHNGHILLESVPGQGTSFTLLFEPVNDPEIYQLKTEAQNYDIAEGNGAEILVVDDEQLLGEHVSELLSHHGYKPLLTTSSQQALELFNQNPNRFSVIVTDQTMPKMTGLELIENIRQTAPNFPAVMCSGYSDKIDAKGAAERNIVYLPKPISSQKLLIEISGLLLSKAG